MDRFDTLTSTIHNAIIDRANELAAQDFQQEEDLKLPLIAYSLIDAAAMYNISVLYDYNPSGSPAFFSPMVYTVPLNLIMTNESD